MRRHMRHAGPGRTSLRRYRRLIHFQVAVQLARNFDQSCRDCLQEFRKVMIGIHYRCSFLFWKIRGGGGPKGPKKSEENVQGSRGKEDRSASGAASKRIITATAIGAVAPNCCHDYSDGRDRSRACAARQRSWRAVSSTTGIAAQKGRLRAFGAPMKPISIWRWGSVVLDLEGASGEAAKAFCGAVRRTAPKMRYRAVKSRKVRLGTPPPARAARTIIYD